MSLFYCLLFLVLSVIFSISFCGLLELLIHILEIIISKIMSDFSCKKIKVRLVKNTKKFCILYFLLFILGCVFSSVVSLNIIKVLTSVTQ